MTAEEDAEPAFDTMWNDWHTVTLAEIKQMHREDDAALLAHIEANVPHGEPTIPYEQLKKEMHMTEPIKPGVHTSEFYTAILGALAAAVPAVLSATSGYPIVAAILGVAAVVLPTVYIWGRAVLKAEAAKETDVIPDNWESTLDNVLEIAKVLAEGAAKAQVNAKPMIGPSKDTNGE